MVEKSGRRLAVAGRAPASTFASVADCDEFAYSATNRTRKRPRRAPGWWATFVGSPPVAGLAAVLAGRRDIAGAMVGPACPAALVRCFVLAEVTPRKVAVLLFRSELDAERFVASELRASPLVALTESAADELLMALHRHDARRVGGPAGLRP